MWFDPGEIAVDVGPAPLMSCFWERRVDCAPLFRKFDASPEAAFLSMFLLKHPRPHKSANMMAVPTTITIQRYLRIFVPLFYTDPQIWHSG
jgi:hypothetical protein